MAYLHNRNGIDYKILSSRKSSYLGHRDYLVESSKSGQIIIAHGWNPKTKDWQHGTYYGERISGAVRRARADFKKK